MVNDGTENGRGRLCAPSCESRRVPSYQNNSEHKAAVASVERLEATSGHGNEEIRQN